MWTAFQASIISALFLLNEEGKLVENMAAIVGWRLVLYLFREAFFLSVESQGI